MASVSDNNNSGLKEGDDNNKLVQQLVPEVLLKRRHDMDEMKARRAAQAFANPRGNRKIAATSKHAVIKVHRPEKFVLEGRQKRNTDIRYQRVLRKGMQKRASDRVLVQQKTIKGSTADAGEGEITKTYASNSVGAKVVFAVRIRNNTAVPRNVQRVMNQLRLKHLYNGVFLKYNDSTRKMLHLVEPFVVYGVLSKSTISDLIHRRGHGKIDGERVPLNNNIIIEKALEEETGIICIEDLVHEICTVGKNFAKAANFLWPFHLTAPKTKFQKYTLRINDTREDYGDKGEEMEEYLNSML